MVTSLFVRSSLAQAASRPSDGETFPSLEHTLQLASQGSIDAVRARAELAVGQANYQGARLSSLANPYLEVFAERPAWRGSEVTKDLNVQANLWLPVEVAGQRGHRVAEVDALVRWKEVSLQAAQARAVGAAVRAYGTVVSQASRVYLLEGLAASARNEAELYQARLAARDITSSDANLVVVEAARHTAAWSESRAALMRALVEFSRTTGSGSISRPESANLHLLPPPPLHPSADSFAAQAMRNCPLLPLLDAEAGYHVKARSRYASEAHTPVNFIVSAGRGDVGETRLGGGLAWTFPILRRNQTEQARAEAERTRVLRERDKNQGLLPVIFRGLFQERELLRAARVELEKTGEPAAQSGVDAAAAMLRGGKGDLFRVIVARRDLALLAFRRLELIEREWVLLSEMVALTGRLS